MTGQGEFWDMARVGDVLVPRARRTDPPTSKKAALSMQEVANVQREAIVQVLRKTRAALTYRDIAALLGWQNDPVRVARRLAELRRAGRVAVHGKRRMPNGREARTYVAA